MVNKFWMVIRVGDSSWTKTRHNTLLDAQKEAERLCRQEQADFVVLESMSYCYLITSPVYWENI